MEWGGGGQFTSNLGPGWTRITPHKEEGFQVSKRDSCARGVIEGSYQGESTRGVCKGIVPWLSIVILHIYMYHAVV